MVKSIVISEPLIKEVEEYKTRRKYGRLSHAVNELIRIGLETEAHKR